MLDDELDALYDTLHAAIPGARPRVAQRQLMQTMVSGLADARFEPDAPPKVAVLEAGTGVGKTRAYLAAGLLLARRAGVKLVVSTSTVALQEQVIGKDLPELSLALEEPPTVALLKGRGRYLCPVRLDQACSGDQEPLDWVTDAQGEGAAEGTGLPASLPAGAAERLLRLRQRWRSRSWDGERDSLDPADLDLWPGLQAERTSCTSRACPQFNACPYFDAKRAASRADVLVTNHDLVLSSLRSDASSLPSGERAVYVFDEGHHLPATALSHFACEAVLTDRRWTARLEKALVQAGQLLRYPGRGFEASAAATVQALDDLVRGLLQTLGQEALAALQTGEGASTGPGTGSGAQTAVPSRTRLRLPDGEWPEGVPALWRAVQGAASRWHAHAQELSAWMREQRAADEDLAVLVTQQMAAIGTPFKRLTDLIDLCVLLQEAGEAPYRPPPAKWLEFEVQGGAQDGNLRIHAKSCPVLASDVLRQQLWSRLRAVIVTSATLRALGRFDFFLRESGLTGLEGVHTAAVDSPFDYPRQGRLLLVDTAASPKDASSHTAEVARRLSQDLLDVAHGALVLCASWVQLRALAAALPAALRAQCRVQGEAPREALLRAHRQAVEAGERAVLMGLQSFGEGLDLPGAHCEWVFMPKLPFSTPDDPVQEARAEWLEAQGRNAFSECVVPATGVRLNQWAGRGIRSEDDHATLVCYDERLRRTPFGRQLLAGLPAFTVLHCPVGVALAAAQPVPPAVTPSGARR